MSPDLLAIGHVAKDRFPGGFRLGGTVTYAACTAGSMGIKPALVTSVGPDLDLDAAMPGIPVHNTPSSDTTTFRNSYHNGIRTQVITGIGASITSSDIPREWYSAPLVLLGPLVGEVSYELAQAFPHAITLASIQGWLRRWNDAGQVTVANWSGEEVLPYVDAAIVSTHDVEDRRLIDRWSEMVSVLILTAGGRGAKVHCGGCWHDVPLFPTHEVDPTGAGDVFAAAYLIRYQESGDPLASARFASCAASFSVQAESVDSIPNRAQVEARLAGGGR